MTLSEKQNILLHNIFGIAPGQQSLYAVKLSLYLKLIENENTAGLTGQDEAVILPSLDGNVKCGNAIVANDFYDDKDIVLFDGEKKQKISAFDWDAEFPEIFEAGGFDCIIGDIVFQEEISEDEVKYLQKKYNAELSDITGYHILSAINLLKKGGAAGFAADRAFAVSDDMSIIKDRSGEGLSISEYGRDNDAGGQFARIIYLKKVK